MKFLKQYLLSSIDNEHKQLSFASNKEICTSNPGQVATEEEIEAWNLYRYFRNKINNRKKSEEKLFKSAKNL